MAKEDKVEYTRFKIPDRNLRKLTEYLKKLIEEKATVNILHNNFIKFCRDIKKISKGQRVEARDKLIERYLENLTHHEFQLHYEQLVKLGEENNIEIIKNTLKAKKIDLDAKIEPLLTAPNPLPQTIKQQQVEQITFDELCAKLDNEIKKGDIVSYLKSLDKTLILGRDMLLVEYALHNDNEDILTFLEEDQLLFNHIKAMSKKQLRGKASKLFDYALKNQNKEIVEFLAGQNLIIYRPKNIQTHNVSREVLVPSFLIKMVREGIIKLSSLHDQHSFNLLYTTIRSFCPDFWEDLNKIGPKITVSSKVDPSQRLRGYLTFVKGFSKNSDPSTLIQYDEYLSRDVEFLKQLFDKAPFDLEHIENYIKDNEILYKTDDNQTLREDSCEKVRNYIAQQKTQNKFFEAETGRQQTQTKKEEEEKPLPQASNTESLNQEQNATISSQQATAYQTKADDNITQEKKQGNSGLDKPELHPQNNYDQILKKIQDSAKEGDVNSLEKLFIDNQKDFREIFEKNSKALISSLEKGVTELLKSGSYDKIRKNIDLKFMPKDQIKSEQDLKNFLKKPNILVRFAQYICEKLFSCAGIKTKYRKAAMSIYQEFDNTTIHKTSSPFAPQRDPTHTSGR